MVHSWFRVWVLLLLLINPCSVGLPKQGKDDSWVITLIGPPGSGKSGAANVILGSQFFKISNWTGHAETTMHSLSQDSSQASEDVAREETDETVDDSPSDLVIKMPESLDKAPAPPPKPLPSNPPRRLQEVDEARGLQIAPPGPKLGIAPSGSKKSLADAVQALSELPGTAPPGAGSATVAAFSGGSSSSSSSVGMGMFGMGRQEWEKGEVERVGMGFVQYEGQSYKVLDTPANSLGQEQIKSLMQRLAEKNEAGVHIFVLTLPFGSELSKDATRAYRNFKEAFGKGALLHTVLVFTGCLGLTEGDVQAEIHSICTLTPDSSLCSGLMDLGLPPIVAFGNTAPTRMERDRMQFFTAVSLALQQNGWASYSNQVFAEVKERRKRQKKAIEELPAGKERNRLLGLLSRVQKGDGDEAELQKVLVQYGFQQEKTTSGQTLLRYRSKKGQGVPLIMVALLILTLLSTHWLCPRWVHALLPGAAQRKKSHVAAQ